MSRQSKILAALLALTFATGVAFAQDDPLGEAAPADAPGEAAAEKPAKEEPRVTPEQEAQGRELFESGRKLFFQGDYEQAIVVLDRAVKTDPTRSGYKLLLAKAHREAGQTDKAASQFAAILEQNPEHVEAGVALAEMLSPTKEPDRLIAILQPLLKFKHDYPLYHLLAEAHYHKDELDQARTYYEEAARLNPRSAIDHYQLGNIYLAQSRFARAADAYQKANELGIDTDVLHFKLASIHFNLRHYVGPIGTAEVIGGEVGQIKNNLLLIDPVPGGEDRFYVARPGSAIFHAVRAQQMGLELPSIRFLEANIWLHSRRFAKAEALYAELEGKLDKEEHGLFWFYRAQAALGLGEYDTYLARLDKAIEAEPQVYKPTLADAYLTVANRYQQQGKTEQHLEYLAKAVQTNPLSTSLHLTLGEAYWQSGRHDGAREQYKLVLELEPDHPDRIRLLNRIRNGAAAVSVE